MIKIYFYKVKLIIFYFRLFEYLKLKDQQCNERWWGSVLGTCKCLPYPSIEWTKIWRNNKFGISKGLRPHGSACRNACICSHIHYQADSRYPSVRSKWRSSTVVTAILRAPVALIARENVTQYREINCLIRPLTQSMTLRGWITPAFMISDIIEEKSKWQQIVTFHHFFWWN